MKFAQIEANGHYRGVVSYDKYEITSDDFTQGGQRIEFFVDNRIVSIFYGKLIADNSRSLTDICIEIAE